MPSFEPLSESTESDSLEEQFSQQQSIGGIACNKPEKPASVNIDDLDDDIGDISSSSEIEIGKLEPNLKLFDEY